MLAHWDFSSALWTLSLPLEDAWAGRLEGETPGGAEMGLERKADHD